MEKEVGRISIKMVKRGFYDDDSDLGNRRGNGNDYIFIDSEMNNMNLTWVVLLETAIKECRW